METNATELKAIINELSAVIYVVFLPILFFLLKRFLKSIDELKQTVQNLNDKVLHTEVENEFTQKSINSIDNDLKALVKVVGEHTKQIGILMTISETHQNAIESLDTQSNNQSKKRKHETVG